MRVKYFLIAALLVVPMALAAVGCSGTSTSTGSTTSPYAGIYTGTFSDSPSGQTGTYSLTINSQGGLYGTVHNVTAATYGQVVGTIDSNGNAVFNITYINTTTTEKGVLTIGVNEDLTGTLTGPQTENVDLVPTTI